MKTIAIIISLLAVVNLAEAKWVFVLDGVVREVYTSKPDFHKDFMLMVFDAPDAVQHNWRKVGDNWLPPKTAQDLENERFDVTRKEIKSKSGIQGRKIMANTLRYKLNGNLDTGYPDKTQPLCTNAAGEALTLSEFNDYIQERDDEGATQQEMQALKQQAKAARLYIKSLKGD